MPENSPRTILAAVPDLFFQAKIGETAKHVGAEVVFVSSGADVLDRDDASLILLDLSAAALDPVGLIGRLKQAPEKRAIPVVGFVNHEAAELIEAARAAGCDRVLSRNAFTKDLPRILEGVSEKTRF